MTAPETPQEEFDFFLGVRGDVAPYNDVFEYLTSEVVHRLHESTRAQFYELIGEIQRLKMLAGPQSKTVGQHMRESGRFILAIDDNADVVPFNDLDAINQAAESNPEA